MPWCPKCKSEYVEGITECADCKILLVDELVETTEEAVEAVAIDDMPVIEVEDDGREDIEKPSFVRKYENYHEKADNFKSSAYTLITVGILGMIALILLYLDVLPIHYYGAGKYLTCIVMGGLFIIFTVVGVKSFHSAKQYESLALHEDAMTENIKKWVLENVDAKKIMQNEKEKNPNMGEEMKYFFYFGALKKQVSQAFPEASEEYLDNLLEELYEQLFERSISSLRS